MTNSLTLISGGREGPGRIALSIVHPRERIDVALADVLAVEAAVDETFVVSDGTTTTFATPHVDVALAPHIRARLYRLMSAIVGEATNIVVGGEVVVSPIVREPLGLQAVFKIKVSDVAEAEALAAKLRQGFVGPKLRAV